MIRYWCFVVMFAARIAPCRSVYLYLPEKTRQINGLIKCRQFGMTQLEIYNQQQLDTWNSVKQTLFALQEQEETGEPWLGLKHDGSQNANEINYNWYDAGTVRFLTWATGEPDNIPQDGCVRIRNNEFGTRKCSYMGYSTVCQPPVNLNIAASKKIFQQVHYETSEKGTVARYSEVTFNPHNSTSNWLIALPARTDVTDSSSCVFLCHSTSYCKDVTFDKSSGCVIFRSVTLPSIH